ncbi:MAG TPA: hypothetical protein VMB71_06295 [Acetobacteraceae bacterium]|nr:hypothetical protein [Acetobacteraceae bacterium]
MAQTCDDDKDRVLWLTLAQSWLRLAEHVARAHEELFSAEEALEAEPDRVA